MGVCRYFEVIAWKYSWSINSKFLFFSEGQEDLTDCNLNKSQEMESMDNGEDVKEHNLPSEEATGKGTVEF